jgi:cAMP-binding proteins - catabolite gene activator and regulatory subunit of cAMP-dependent protein kinases
MPAVFKTTGGKESNNSPKDYSIAVASGDHIFHEGDLGTEMYIILEGEVQIVKRLGGQAHILSRLDKGDFFGEMSVIDGVPRTADAVAVTGCKLVPINGSRFDEMIRRTPEIAIRIIRKYSNRLRESNRLLEQFIGDQVEVAIASATAPPISTETQAAQPDQKHAHRLVDVATGNAFFFSRGDETTIGRADPVTGILPDVDLTPVDTDRSVSRRHAKILHREGEYLVLEEVGTVNGTYVNDQRIPTGHPVPIHHGDRLKIGLIQMKVVFD